MRKATFETGRAWIEVNAENLHHNAETLKRTIQPAHRDRGYRSLRDR